MGASVCSVVSPVANLEAHATSDSSPTPVSALTATAAAPAPSADRISVISASDAGDKSLFVRTAIMGTPTRPLSAAAICRIDDALSPHANTTAARATYDALT